MNKNTDENIIKRFLNGTYTKEEADKVFDIIKNCKSNHAFDKCMAETWEESQAITPSDNEIQHLRQEALLLLNTEKRKYITFPRIYLRRAISIVASVAIIVLLGVGGRKYLSISADNQTLVEQSVNYGETKSIVLPDGTKVTLNSCSKIVYPSKFTLNERKIELTGEAYFQVVKNDKQPFIVNTNKFDIKVLGTVFNVKAYKDDILQSVNVETGKVQVDMEDAMVRLNSAEQIDINKQNNDFIKYGEADFVAAWRKGYLQFNKTPIADVINELERNYNIRFTFEKGQLFDNHITGQLTNTSLDDILEILEHVSGIHFRYDETKGVMHLYK